MESDKNRRLRISMEEVQNKTIYLYGAGIRGKVALENLNMLGFGQCVEGFIDDNRQGVYCEKPIYLVKDAKLLEDNNVFIITTYNVNKMICKLMHNRISAKNIYYFPELLIDDIKVSVFKDNKKKIEQVFDFLNDSLSKYIYKSIFEIYMGGNIGILSRTKGDIQYFPIQGSSDEIEEFHLSENEGFVDCGAYIGDTIRQFRIRVNDKYRKIWAFEPDVDNYTKLSDYIGETNGSVQLFQGGVYSEDTVMYFNGNQGTASTLSSEGEESAKVYKLDSVIDEPVTYIKMDIEGAEKEALLGAKEIIGKYKPKLAICIYHKVEDMWEIPILIKELNPNYHIYVRNYEDRIDETICYAF